MAIDAVDAAVRTSGMFSIYYYFYYYLLLTILSLILLDRSHATAPLPDTKSRNIMKDLLQALMYHVETIRSGEIFAKPLSSANAALQS